MSSKSVLFLERISWVFVLVSLASTGAENYCQTTAVVGANHTTTISADFKQTRSFEWSFDGEFVSCNVTDKRCSSTDETKYQGSIVLLADEKIKASFTIVNVGTHHHDLPLVWTEKMDTTTRLTLKRDACQLVTYEPYSTPEVIIKERVFDGTTKLNFYYFLREQSRFPVIHTVTLEMRGHNPKNSVVKKAMRIINEDIFISFDQSVEAKELAPGTYTAYLILYPKLPIGNPAKDFETFEIDTYTFDIKPPVCQVSNIMNGKQFAVYCTSERSYFPEVDCAIIKTDREWGQVERYPGKTRSECEKKSGRCIIHCFLFEDISFNNIGNVSFRAEMIPIVVNKNLVIADAVMSEETDVFKIGGQFCPTHAIVQKQYNVTLDLSPNAQMVKWSFAGEDAWCSLENKTCNASSPRFNRTTILQRGSNGSISSSFVIDSISENDDAKIIEWTEKDENDDVVKNIRCRLKVRGKSQHG